MGININIYKYRSKYLGVIMDNVPCGLGITQLTDGLFDCGNYEDGVV